MQCGFSQASGLSMFIHVDVRSGVISFFLYYDHTSRSLERLFILSSSTLFFDLSYPKLLLCGVIYVDMCGIGWRLSLLKYGIPPEEYIYFQILSLGWQPEVVG